MVQQLVVEEVFCVTQQVGSHLESLGAVEIEEPRLRVSWPRPHLAHSFLLLLVRRRGAQEQGLVKFNREVI